MHDCDDGEQHAEAEVVQRALGGDPNRFGVRSKRFHSTGRVMLPGMSEVKFVGLRKKASTATANASVVTARYEPLNPERGQADQDSEQRACDARAQPDRRRSRD